MERRNSTEWIKTLKIAIINNDLNKIEEYSKRNIPEFSSIDEAKEALNLINQATNILSTKKHQIGKVLQELKQAKKFIQTTNQSSIFNIEA
jgi:hypothetical protein